MTTCPDPRILTTQCSADNALDIVKGKCDGKKKCRVKSSNKMFGDPCQGTYKYLTVRYTCQGKFGFQKK